MDDQIIPPPPPGFILGGQPQTPPPPPGFVLSGSSPAEEQPALPPVETPEPPAPIPLMRGSGVAIGSMPVESAQRFGEIMTRLPQQVLGGAADMVENAYQSVKQAVTQPQTILPSIKEGYDWSTSKEGQKAITKGMYEQAKGFVGYLPESALGFVKNPKRFIEERPADAIFLFATLGGSALSLANKVKARVKITEPELKAAVDQVSQKMSPPVAEPPQTPVSPQNEAIPPIEQPKTQGGGYTPTLDKAEWQMTRAEWAETTKNKILASMEGDLDNPLIRQHFENVKGLPSTEVADLGKHKNLVRHALERPDDVLFRGKPVPPEVLADYPDLAQKAKGYTPTGEGPEAGSLPYGATLPKQRLGLRFDKILNEGLTPETATDKVYELKKTLLDEADLAQKEIQAGRKLGTKWEETQGTAQGILDKNTIDDLAKKWGVKTKELAGFQRAMNNATVEYTGMLKKYRDAYTADPHEGNLANLMRAVEFGKTFLGEAAAGKSEIARALNINKNIYQSAEGLRTRNYAEAIKALGGREVTEEIAKRLSTIDFESPAEVAKFIRGVSKATTSEKVFEVWINSILTNPPGHLANIVGNTLTLAGKPMESFMAGAVEPIRAKLTGQVKQRFVGESGYNILGSFHGFKEGYRKMLYAWKNGIPEGGTGSKLEYAPVGKEAIKGKVGRFVRTPTRALMSADEFFKGWLYTMDIYGQAYREGAKMGLKGRALDAKIAELIESPTEPMMTAARQDAIYRTFQSEPGFIVKKIMQFREMRVPGTNVEPMKYVLPFVKTPANILKYGLSERTPYGIVKTLGKAAIPKSGYFKTPEFSDAMGRALIGSGFMAMLFSAAGNDVITGSGAFMTPSEKRQKMAQGWLPNSIKFGNKYYSYQRLDPLSNVAGVAADFADLLKNNMSASEDEKVAIGTGLMKALVKNAVNKSYLQSISDMTDALTDPEGFRMERFVRTLTSSVIPSSVGAAARAIDPDVREVKSIMDGIKAKIPFASKSIQAKIDVTGENVKKGGTPLTRAFLPTTISQEKPSKTLSEMERLGITLGMPNKKIKDASGVERELARSEYQGMTKAEWKKINDDVAALMGRADYVRIPDANKKKMIKAIIARARRGIRNQYE